MATLFNTKISATYPGLIKTIDNTALNATLKELTDGSGNQSGLYANTSGDFKVTAILEFGSLKDTGENIIITKFVDAADGIPNNNNDTSIPTSKAVKDYVEAHVTAQDLDFGGDGGTTGAIDLDSQVFQINGTSNEIETSASNQVLTIGLPNSVTISGTFTGATFAGQLSGTISSATTATTQSAGDNSTKVATTAYVDVLDAASDLDFSGDSGTGDVTLNSQVFAVTGTTNQIVTAASGQGLSLSLPATVHRNLQGNVTGNVTGDLTGNVTATSVLANGVTATTQSSSDDSTKVATTAYVKGLNNASDLDFTGDSGTGAVVLNSQSFAVNGTTNQITTSASGQAITLSLPSTVHRNLQGNVTGDLTGNADTATKWATARDLSLTGQATATLSSVDGTSAVSGAITLDNNSVTSKVLTGLPTPSASSVLATDSIVAGIGKLQSQINGLAGGLRFMGTWNVSTNSPALASGGGETASGTTTSTTANKLVDSNASFSGAVSVGNKVVNQVDGQTALVSNVDSDTTLSLDADIMLSGEAYTIDASPFLTQGHYYVVSVGGARTLNGVTNWSVGDWAIVGSNNEWTILDHTDVEGTGTAGNISKWSGPGTIADSIIAESGTAINITGSLATTLGASFTGNLAVNTNKFTANATSGNVAFPGDLAINTNKFTVAATSGNTVIAGDVSLPDNQNVNIGTGNDLQLYHNGSNSYIDNTTGSLLIRNTNDDYHVIIQSDNGGGGVADYFRAKGDTGEAILYHYGTEKFKTTSTGVSVTGDGLISGDLGIGGAPDNLLTLTGTAGTTHQRFKEVSSTIGFIGGANGIISSHDGKLALRAESGLVLSGQGNAADLVIDSGNSTFGGTVETTTLRTDVINNKANSANIIYRSGTDTIIGGGSASQKLTIADSGNATFAGSVTCVGLDSQIAGNVAGYFASNTSINANQIVHIRDNVATTSVNSAGGIKISSSPGNDVFLVKRNETTSSFFGLQNSSGTEFITVNMASGNAKINSDTSINRGNQTSGELLLGGTTDGGFVDFDGTNLQLNTQRDPNTGTFINSNKSHGGIQILGPSGGSVIKFATSEGNGPSHVATTKVTINSSGSVSFTESLYIPDAKKVVLGSGSDFQIYHDGSNSYIQNLTGWLNIPLTQNGISIANADFSESVARFLLNGACELYYDGAKKFETVSTGVDVFGTSGNTNIRVYDSSGNSEVGLKLQGDAKTWILQNWGSGGDKLRVLNNDGNSMQVWEDDGNVIFGAVDINGSFGASNTVLAIKGSASGGEGILQITGLGNNATDNVGTIDFHSYNEADPMCSIRSVRGSADDVGDLKFYTNSGGGAPSQRMTITSGGDVGISNGNSFSIGSGTSEAKTQTEQTGAVDSSGKIILTTISDGMSSATVSKVTVYGNNNSTAGFYDEVLVCANAGRSPQVITALETSTNTAHTRTYTNVGNSLKLVMGGSSYNVNVKSEAMGYPF